MDFNRMLMKAQHRTIDAVDSEGNDYRNYYALVKASHDPVYGVDSFYTIKKWFSDAKDAIQDRQDMRYAPPDSLFTALIRRVTGEQRDDWTQRGPVGGRKKYKKTYMVRKSRKHRRSRKH